MADLDARVRAAFAAAFGGEPALVARAPGRVNLIGEHTDYNDGFVLPMAIGCETRVAARGRGDRTIRIVAADFGEQDSFGLDGPIESAFGGTWANYVRGVAASLADDGVMLAGCEIAIAGNIPRGAGLSSSASLEIATGLAFAAMAGVPDFDRTRLALAGQRAEHEFAGCHCGIMDQLVSARAHADAALLIDCRTLETRAIALPPDMAVMIVHSGVSRGLVEGEYNARRADCEAVAAHFGVAALRDLDLATLDRRDGEMSATHLRRARHVVTENARVLASVDALAAGDLAALGSLFAASHASMRDDFAITVPAVDQLAAILQSAIGANGGARMTGGGFGGAVVAVLPQSEVERVRAAVLETYRCPARAMPVVMVEQASAGAAMAE